jgi:hypothetical protein
MYRAAFPLPAVWTEKALPASTVLGNVRLLFCATTGCIIASAMVVSKKSGLVLIGNLRSCMSK